VSTGSQDGKIKVFDVRSRRMIQHYNAHDASVNCLDFNPAGTFLVSGSSDHKVKIWDVRAGKLGWTLRSAERAVHAVGFSRDGNYFAQCGADALVMVWKANIIEQEDQPTGEQGHRLHERTAL